MSKRLGETIAQQEVAGLLHAVRRPLHTGWIHCSASDRPEHDRAQVMDQWHRARGWSGIGYHAFITKSGVVQMGRDWGQEPAAQEGHNTGALALCLHGLALERFALAQFAVLQALAAAVDAAHLLRWRGHCEVAAKACPVFDYRRVLGLDARGQRQPHGATEVHTAGTVRLFDRGDQVAQVQQALCDRGAFLVVDGLFGRATEAAVIAFQTRAGVTPDGVVGPETWAALAAVDG